LILKVITNQGSRKLEIEVKRLHEEVATLKAAIEAAIEEAIKNGQKSVDGLDDIPDSGLVSNEDFSLTHINADSGVVGWVDNF
jgi:hypothetical protein